MTALYYQPPMLPGPEALTWIAWAALYIVLVGVLCAVMGANNR